VKEVLGSVDNIVAVVSSYKRRRYMSRVTDITVSGNGKPTVCYKNRSRCHFAPNNVS
jgi:hypothetical protein